MFIVTAHNFCVQSLKKIFDMEELHRMICFEIFAQKLPMDYGFTVNLKLECFVRTSKDVLLHTLIPSMKSCGVYGEKKK